MSTLPQLLQRIATNVQQQNGSAVAQLLLLANQSMIAHLQDAHRVQQQCASSIPRPFDQIVSLHLRSLYASHAQEHAKAIELETQAADLLYTAMESDRDSNWLLAPINVVARQLRLCSYAADALLVRQGQKARHMIEAQDLLKRFLQRMVIDRAPAAQSKKQGCLFLIVHLFKLYFKLNNLKLCMFLIKMVAQLPPLHTYPLAQQVAYQFYLGRLNVFEEKYVEAEQCLDFAFRRCPRVCSGNKRRILHFLVPLRLLHARFPTDALLAKHGLLPQFGGLIQSIKRGDLEHFNAHMAANQTFFVARGIYLILEKLKVFVYRNLFRKVHQFHVRENADATAGKQLPLDLLLAALRVNGTDMSVDELECILANLIFHGKIKGYIAHKRCLVLSKQDPFPKVS